MIGHCIIDYYFENLNNCGAEGVFDKRVTDTDCNSKAV